MKTITTTGGNFTRLSDWIGIYHLQVKEGWVSYFDFDGITYAMDEVVRLGSIWANEQPYHFIDGDGSQRSIVGIATALYYCPIYLELSDCGELVRLYEREREYEVD